MDTSTRATDLQPSLRENQANFRILNPAIFGCPQYTSHWRWQNLVPPGMTRRVFKIHDQLQSSDLISSLQKNGLELWHGHSILIHSESPYPHETWHWSQSDDRPWLDLGLQTPSRAPWSWRPQRRCWEFSWSVGLHLTTWMILERIWKNLNSKIFNQTFSCVKLCIYICVCIDIDIDMCPNVLRITPSPYY